MTATALMPSLQPTTVIDRGGMAALTIGAMQSRVALVLELMANVLEEGKDYGKIPGTDKPTLLKPGAEKLCLAFQLASAKPLIEDLSTPDEIRYREYVPLETPDGRVLAVGIGEASTSEEKHRWRRPVCDEEFFETPEHLRREKWFKGRDGAFKGKQVRTSPADHANTVLKMAHKRALIHGTLLATAASSVFNQDLEDFTKELQESVIEGEVIEAPATAAPKGPQRKSASGSSSAAKPAPANAEAAIGYIARVFDDKKPYAILLKGSSTKFTTFDEKVAAAAKQFEGTDHTVRLTFTTTEKDGRTYHNAVGVAIMDDPTTLTAGDIPFGG